MSNFLNGLIKTNNFKFTENEAITHNSTKSALLDLFAMGAAYRNRTDSDCIVLFKNAYQENPTYALKCLFYLADIRGGQGERRFFRVIIKWLANYDPDAVRRNLAHIPTYRRWDDFYALVDTPLEADAFAFMKHQLALDVNCKTPSLLAKWLKSENASSSKTRHLARKTAKAFGMTPKQYRKTLSILRERINVLERLMSAGKWDEIEFDKIPSRAGLIYKNAFAKHDLEREQSKKAVQTYAEFAKDTTKKVNAKDLYPYECVEKALKLTRQGYWGSYDANRIALDNTDRLMINKYWDNLTDYFNGANFNALAVVDTSASMSGTPMNVAISLGLYCAERCKGPFNGYYVSFSRTPRLVRTEGVDFCDKVARIANTNLCENTNIEATFDMLLNTALANHCTQDELPQNIVVISDMEFDAGTGQRNYWGNGTPSFKAETLMESIRKKWAAHGYQMPHLIYWNVDARQDNIPEDLGNGPISYVSGFSPSIFQTIMAGKTGYELMLDKLNSERYAVIQ